MVSKTTEQKIVTPKDATGASEIGRSLQTGKRSVASAVMDQARRAGLLDGDKTEHVSFRAPKALIEAAMRESGVTRPTELGILALAMLAQPDPTAKFLKETRGVLGSDHLLDY